MRYSDEAFEFMMQTLQERREKAQNESEKRRAYVYEKLPEVKKLENSLKDSYLKLYQIIALHKSNAAEAARKVAEDNLAAQQKIKQLVRSLTNDENYLEPHFFCEKCKDTGKADGKRCECAEELLKEYMVRSLNESSSISVQDFSRFSLEYYPQGEIRDRMASYLRYFKDYCTNFPDGCNSLLFIGKTGLGKTLISCCMAKEIASRGFSVLLVSAPDILRKIEDEHFGRSEGSTLDSVIAADIAIIDDLGSEFTSPFYDSALYNIINGRINLHRPTIISTNMSSEKLNERYNERIVSRLLNDFMPILFVGSDIRQLRSAKRYGKK